MNKTVGGKYNPALDMASREATKLARISEDTAAKKRALVETRKENVFEMQTIGRNEPGANPEQAINPNKRSESMVLDRLFYFMVGVVVISLLIASAALVLVLIVMFHSTPATLTDPTVHGSGLSPPARHDHIDQEIKNLTEHLQTVQIQLENIAKRTTNLVSKVNNSSEMVCPICPKGFNGSQGPRGPDSSASILRYNGTGAFSACQYKTVKTLEKPGNQTTVSVLDEPQGKRVIGVTCSANYGAENNLYSRIRNSVQRYACSCRKTYAPVNPPQGENKTCVLHYWQCPLTP